MENNGYKKFDSYVGSTTLGSGIIPANEKYPLLIQSSNVQIDEEGHSLYDLLESGELGGSDDNIIGTWVLNDFIRALSAGTYDLIFTSNATLYTHITFELANLEYFYIKYGNVVVYVSPISSPNEGIWADSTYKTITIHGNPIDDIATWVRANGNRSGRQQEADARLKTHSKRIVDAINEVNEKTNLDEELTEQDSLIEQIKTALKDKVSGGLPKPTVNDNGKFLSVVNGVATWVDLPVAEDVVIRIAEEITLNGR